MALRWINFWGNFWARKPKFVSLIENKEIIMDG